MTATTKPAILSAAEIERIRRNTSTGLLGEDTRAPLAHIDALTAGAAGPDAGRRLYYELNPRAHRDAWEASDPDVRERHDKAAASLRAAGRSEGGAERERLSGLLRHGAQTYEDAHAEIARLAAELAEARNELRRQVTMIRDLGAEIEVHASELDAARAEGARVERDALLAIVEEGIRRELPHSIVAAIRARGEGGQV